MKCQFKMVPVSLRAPESRLLFFQAKVRLHVEPEPHGRDSWKVNQGSPIIRAEFERF